MRLLDGFAEAARREMDLAPVAFGAVGAEEGLEEGGAGGFWLLVSFVFFFFLGGSGDGVVRRIRGEGEGREGGYT